VGAQFRTRQQARGPNTVLTTVVIKRETVYQRAPESRARWGQTRRGGARVRSSYAAVSWPAVAACLVVLAVLMSGCSSSHQHHASTTPTTTPRGTTPVPSSSAVGAPPARAFNVVTYGADPTGARDSTEAIRNAITAAENAGGHQTVYFPSGTYLLNDTKGTKTLGKTRDARNPNVPIVAEIYINGSNGSVIDILGAGENVTKVVEAVGITNPQYSATLQRGYNAFVFTHMNGFSFSGLTVDSARYTAGDTLEDFGSNTTIENSDFIGSQTSTPTRNPDVFGLRVLGVCRFVPTSNDGAAAGYSGSEFHTGNSVKNITVSGGGQAGASDLGFACQSHGTISNVTDTGWGLALYVDYDVAISEYNFTPGSDHSGDPGFYITDASGVSINDFRSAGQGGIVGGSGDNKTFNTTITNETMTGSGYTLQVRNVHDMSISDSTLNQLQLKASVGIDGLMVTNSTINGLPSSTVSPPSVPCKAQPSATVTDLSGIRCSR
jgi:hypothetical protein